MKMVCGIVAVVGVLSAVPAVAADYVSGQGYTTIWSSAQGTSFSYGQASAASGSGSQSSGIGGGGFQGTLGTLSNLGAVNSSSMSFANTSSNGSGYGQAQSSGYAGGSAGGAAGRSH